MIPRKFAFDWLNNNPLKWRGKKVRNKKTGVAYTIKEVLRNGNVAMERKWVLYTSKIQTIREGYEPASP
jgi:hypothetical protein